MLDTVWPVSGPAAEALNHGTDLAQVLSAGHGHGHRSELRCRRSSTWPSRASRRSAERVAYIQMGTALTYGELDRKSRDFAAWLQNVAGLKRGDRLAIMLPNVLQYPIAMFGGAARGSHGRQHQSALHRAGTRTSAQGLRLHRHRGARELRPRARGGAARARRSGMSSPPASGSCSDFRKSAVVNFVVRRVHKQVPPWNIPGAQSFRRGAGSRARALPSSRSSSLTMTSPFCSTPAARPAWPRARCSRTATSARMCCRLRRGSIRSCRVPPMQTRYLITPIPLYHIFALTANCMLFLRLGWSNVLITNPRDFPALRRGAEALSVRRIFSGVNTLFNALLHTLGLRRSRFQPPEDHARRRHGRAGNRGDALEGGHRQPD